MQPIIEFLSQHPNPGQVVRWLQRSGGSAFLHSIVQGTANLSHTALDIFPSERQASFLRSLLVQSGALPQINAMASSLNRWAKRFLDGVPSEDRSLLTMFFEWRILRRLRRKIEKNQLTEAGRKWAQSRLRSAAQFLRWLGDRGKGIDVCSQEDVDRWLVDMETTTAYGIRDFIRWTVNRKLSPQLIIPLRKVRSSLPTQDDELRWSMIERLTREKSISLDLRLIGIFNLAFGQQLSRTLQLINTSITVREEEVSVTFGHEPVVMPPVIGQLMREQITVSRENPKSHRPDGTWWLFPGQNYGHRLTPDTVQKRLKSIGVSTRPGRNAALFDLAGKVQPAILSRLLNISPGTAVIWGELAGHNYSRYVASRKKTFAARQSSKGPLSPEAIRRTT